MKRNLLLKHCINATRFFALLFVFSSFTCLETVKAQCTLLNEGFNANPVLAASNTNGAWYPDRYAPAEFASEVLNGQSVLKISIDGGADRGSYTATFYNTQGRKFNQCGRCVTVMKGDLWIPQEWEFKHRRSDMWATAYDASNAVQVYPIIGFRNPDGHSPGIYYWDDNLGWVNSGVSIIYGRWYSLEFSLDGSDIQYFVNGASVGKAPTNGATYFGDVMLQAYNFNDPALPVENRSSDSYDAFWDNVKTTGTGGNVVTNLNTGISYCSIQGAINDALTVDGHTIQVNAGTYKEDVNMNKRLTLTGAGIDQSLISGVIGGDGATVRINASGTTIQGFTITREGNNTDDWNNPGLNSAGIAIQGQSITNTLIQSNKFVGNRTAIDINNSNGHSIIENDISNNRTGVIFRNQTENITLTNNFVTNNWTAGILFLDASNGTNVPVQSAAHSTFKFNNISGNWYAQVVDRQAGGSLPIPGTSNTKDFTCNWWGSLNPVVTTANSAEPGYGAQIPIAYGGTATSPGGQPDIAGPASANIVYAPYLVYGVDDNITVAGFQQIPYSCRGYAYIHCGKKDDKKVMVCHNGKPLCISVNGLQEHLDHNDLLGNCASQSITQAAPLEMTEALLGVSKLQIYPNPSFGQFTLQLNDLKASKAQIVLMDQNGRTIEQRSIQLINGQQSVIYNTRKFASGMYTVKVVSEDGVHTSKVVIQH
jgi:hypothetical protein